MLAHCALSAKSPFVWRSSRRHVVAVGTEAMARGAPPTPGGVRTVNCPLWAWTAKTSAPMAPSLMLKVTMSFGSSTAFSGAPTRVPPGLFSATLRVGVHQSHTHWSLISHDGTCERSPPAQEDST